MIGTPAYLAPEIWNSQPASPATDEYSLACVFYELITGQSLRRRRQPAASGDEAPPGPAGPAALPAAGWRASGCEPRTQPGTGQSPARQVCPAQVDLPGRWEE